MCPHRVIDLDLQKAKRQLRAEISRSRVRTAASLAALGDQRRRLTSWRTYVGQFPMASLAISFAAGLLLTMRPGRRVPRMVGSSLARWGFASIQAGMWQEVVNLVSGLLAQRSVQAPPADET